MSPMQKLLISQPIMVNFIFKHRKKWELLGKHIEWRGRFSMLWVMTQNKQSLVKVKDVTVKGKYIEGFIENSLLEQWNKTLGKYESNERAMEIISEIYTKIEESNGVYVTYTMPEK